MKHTKHLVITLILFAASSLMIRCSTPAFPDEQMRISPTLASIYKAIESQDSIAFTNQNINKRLFIFGKKDSSISNLKKGFFDTKPYNNWKIYFETLENEEKIKYQNYLYVNRNPTDNLNTICIRLSDFYYLGDTLPPLRLDTFKLGHVSISHFYRITPNGTFGIDYAMKALYIDDKTGFLGFEMQNGDVWVNDILQK